MLLNGADRVDAEPFRLAVQELVAGGYFMVTPVEERRLLGTRQRQVLVPGDDRTRPDALSLAALWDMYHSTPVQLTYRRSYPGGVMGVTLGEFSRAAADHFGSLEHYGRRVVVPALVRAGLMEERQAKMLWVIPTTRLALTAAGEAKRQELQNLLWMGQEQTPGWAAQDPTMGMQYMMLAGAAMFLMPALLPDFQQIREAAPDGAPGAGSAQAWDFSALEAFEQAWDAEAGDSAQADGGGDSGGDGGDGGDGGGSSD